MVSIGFRWELSPWLRGNEVTELGGQSLVGAVFIGELLNLDFLKLVKFLLSSERRTYIGHVGVRIWEQTGERRTLYGVFN